MRTTLSAILFISAALLAAGPATRAESARNPIIHADVPDVSIMVLRFLIFASSKPGQAGRTRLWAGAGDLPEATAVIESAG